MKSILKLTALLTGAIANVTIAMASAATVGRITIAGDASLSNTQLTFANNSAIITSTFFSEGVDTDGNPLPNLGLNGDLLLFSLSTFLSQERQEMDDLQHLVL